MIRFVLTKRGSQPVPQHFFVQHVVGSGFDPQLSSKRKSWEKRVSLIIRIGTLLYICEDTYWSKDDWASIAGLIKIFPNFSTQYSLNKPCVCVCVGGGEFVNAGTIRQTEPGWHNMRGGGGNSRVVGGLVSDHSTHLAIWCPGQVVEAWTPTTQEKKFRFAGT